MTPTDRLHSYLRKIWISAFLTPSISCLWNQQEPISTFIYLSTLTLVYKMVKIIQLQYTNKTKLKCNRNQNDNIITVTIYNRM